MYRGGGGWVRESICVRWRWVVEGSMYQVEVGVNG